MKTNLKGVLNELEQFILNHNIINSFGFGNVDNISTKDMVFPLCWLMPVPSQLENNMASITFDMYMMDLLKQDLSNLHDVMSDTLILGSDVVANFFDNEEEYDFVLDESYVSIQPFQFNSDVTDDATGGWIFTITIQIQNDLNDCSIPTNL